jgi:signal transduction histidine kinase/prenyltransferase beta subunit
MRQISGSYTSTYLLIVTLAFLVLGATLQVAAFYHDAEVQMRETDYATALEEYNAMNIYYEPDNIAYYVKIRQNPAGYFVLNPDLIFEPSELGKDSMKSTRFAVVTLDKLNQTEQMNGNATVNYVMGNYVNYSIAETSYAGFRMHEGFDPGVRTTCDAVMTLVSLGALDDPELDLDAVERFILAHRNPDGGFWDEDYAQDGMNSTLKCTSFALRALGRIYQHQDRGFSADFKDGVVGFVDSCFDESDGGYADRPGGESIETYATFRAFISLWWLGGNNDLERRAFVTQNMDLQKSVDYLLDNHYYPETGAFSRYEDKSKGNESLKGTHLMIWFLKDMDMEEKLDINHLGHYVMDHEVLPGQYGEDIYSTYAAVLVLTRLNISTEPLPVPEYLPILPLGYPNYLPLVFIVLGFMALVSTYFTERRAMESEKTQREILEKLVEERTKRLRAEVAERRRADDELRVSEGRYRALFENCAVSLWEEDFSQVKKYLDDLRASGITNFRSHFHQHPKAVLQCVKLVRVVDVNRATLDLHKLKDRKEMLGELEKTFSEDGLKVFREEIVALADGHTHFQSEIEHLVVSGEKRNLILWLTVPPGYEDSLSKVYLSMFDITERRRAEEKLKQYAERMEELVEERTKDLREAQEQLVQKERLAVLGQLGAGIGHELRNPLGAIKNAAYFLRMVFEEPEPEVKDTIDIIEKEVATSEKIISSLLSYVRPRPPTRRKVDINDIITAALSVVTIPGDIEVVSELDEGLPTILADPDQLRQVFVNLIINALQAQPRGGHLVVKSWSPGPDSVDVSIADTGVGISQENIPNLFKPLFTTKAKGIGLGLAIVKTLVEGHSGTIDVQSEPDKGTTFTVRIPVVLRGSE